MIKSTTIFFVLGMIMCGTTMAHAAEPAADVNWQHLPRWRGFNLLEMFIKHGDGQLTPFREEDFQIIHDWGFNFVRLPLDYRFWITDGDWTKFNEAALKQVDQAVAWGQKYDIHVMINFHRAPGYTVARPPEKTSVWTDEQTLRVCALHWATFARRYRGVPSAQLSFNLFNEPNNHVTAEQYAHVVDVLCKAIRAEDPDRLIVCDGLGWGNKPVPELVQFKVAQATRGYQPFDVTHYKASWAGKWDDAPVPVWPVMRVNQYLYGPGGDKAKWHRPLVIDGPFSGAMKLRVRVHQVSGDGELVIKADDAAVLRHNFAPGPGEGEWKRVVYQPQWKVYQNIYERDYTAEIPTGTKRITFELAHGDWLRVSELALTGDTKDTPEQKLQLSDITWGAPEQQPIGYTSDGWQVPRIAGRQQLWAQHVQPWVTFAQQQHVGVMVGEFGAYNKTPHDVVMRWIEDCLANWKRAGFGWALWNLRGSFGVLDSDRPDVQYENFRGHKLDRQMLELLQRY